MLPIGFGQLAATGKIDAPLMTPAEMLFDRHGVHTVDPGDTSINITTTKIHALLRAQAKRELDHKSGNDYQFTFAAEYFAPKAVDHHTTTIYQIPNLGKRVRTFLGQLGCDLYCELEFGCGFDSDPSSPCDCRRCEDEVETKLWTVTLPDCKFSAGTEMKSDFDWKGLLEETKLQK